MQSFNQFIPTDDTGSDILHLRREFPDFVMALSSSYLNDSDLSGSENDFSGFSSDEIPDFIDNNVISDDGSDIFLSDIDIAIPSDSSDTDDDQPNWLADVQDNDISPFIQQSGPSHNLPKTAPEMDYFHLYFPVGLIANIVIETNKFAAEQQDDHETCDQNWTDTSVPEMSAFLGMLILMGIIQAPDYSFYWSNDNFLSNQGIKDVMPRRRFEKLLQYFHLNDDTTDFPADHPNHDKLHKIRPVLDEVLANIEKTYKPRQHQTIDEGMIAFKGRHKAKQYLPSKPIKWGMKVWMRCDSLSGFCHQFEFYQGKEDVDQVNDSRKGLGYRVVQRLTKPLRSKYYHVYFDNFFTSIRLVRSLLRHGIYASGTMRKNRKGFPEEFKYPPYMEQGDHIIRQDGYLTATLWKDKKPLTVLSTAADPTIIDIANRKQKDGTVQQVNRPRAVTNYQQYYRGVDICDQLRAKYPVGRASKKWWRYMFHFIVNICIINAFITMVESHLDSQERRKRFRQLDFRINLAKQLIGGFKCRKIAMQQKSLAPVTPANIDTHRLQTLKRKRSTCKYCTKHGEKRRKETKFGCGICNVHLCGIECHSAFHQDMVIIEE